MAWGGWNAPVGTREEEERMSVISNRISMVAKGGLALAMLATVAAAPVAAQDTDMSELSGSINADGSSTVYPITQAVAEEFNAEAGGVDIRVDFSGTGGGFERFCNGETDISDASRPIEQDEIEACTEAGVDYYVFEVAYDALTIVVNPENDFASCLTTDELFQIWSADGGVSNWSDVNPDFPDEPITLFGPGTDSGTFDYFVEAIIEGVGGDDAEIRQDFTPSEDDNVLVEGVAGDANALGYFGLAYFVENQERLTAVEVDGGDGCVAASPETTNDGSYQPLSRPLYVYVSAASMERPEVQEFMRFYIENAAELAADVGYVASPDETYTQDAEKIEAAIAGEAQADGPEGAGEAEATPAA